MGFVNRESPMTTKLTAEEIRVRDSELVTQLLSGNHEAVHAIWLNYEPLVRRVIKERVADPDDRDEIANDVFLSLGTSGATIAPSAPLGSVLATIAKRRCADFHRRKYRSKDALEHATSMESLGTSADPESGEGASSFEDMTADRDFGIMGSGNYSGMQGLQAGTGYELVSSAGLEEELIADETRALIFSHIAALPQKRLEPLTDLVEGLSQAEVSKKYGIPTSTLSRWFKELERVITAQTGVSHEG